MEKTIRSSDSLPPMKPKATPSEILSGFHRTAFGRGHLACPGNGFHGSRRRDHGYRGGAVDRPDDFSPVDGGEPPLEYELDRYRRIPNPVSTRESRNAFPSLSSRARVRKSSAKSKKRQARRNRRRR